MAGLENIEMDASTKEIEFNMKGFRMKVIMCIALFY